MKIYPTQPSLDQFDNEVMKIVEANPSLLGLNKQIQEFYASKRLAVTVVIGGNDKFHNMISVNIWCFDHANILQSRIIYVTI